jgi:predicted aspartyl protease
MNMKEPMQKYLPALGALAALLLAPLLSRAAGDAGSCRYVPVAKLPIEYSDATHRAIVMGTVNGKSTRMIVDTGAYATAFFRSGAERLGLPLDMTGKYSSGIGGASVNYVTRVDDFSVGIAHSGRAPIQVIGNSSKPDGDALVGADFLLQTDMELSLADKYLQFFRASGCGDTYLAYWDSNAMEIPFTGKEGRSNKPYVTVELNGVKLTAILDTGAPHSSVTRHGAELAGIRVDDPGVRKGGKTGGIGDERVDTWFATFDSFSIGPESMKHVELAVHDEASIGRGAVEMLLGADFLRAHRILFAMSQDRLYMSYLGGDPFPPRKVRTAP